MGMESFFWFYCRNCRVDGECVRGVMHDRLEIIRHVNFSSRPTPFFEILHFVWWQPVSCSHSYFLTYLVECSSYLLSHNHLDRVFDAHGSSQEHVLAHGIWILVSPCNPRFLRAVCLQLDRLWMSIRGCRKSFYKYRLNAKIRYALTRSHRKLLTYPPHFFFQILPRILIRYIDSSFQPFAHFPVKTMRQNYKELRHLASTGWSTSLEEVWGSGKKGFWNRWQINSLSSWRLLMR